ncbi:MAG: type 4 pilus major pilin [Acidiferrobacterales bacterium]|nr:type 4 pilus major pilin [Acidiferrobacterales bacterium]
MISILLTKFSALKQTEENKEKGAVTVAETLIALGVGATVLAVVFAGIPALVNARNSSAAVSGLTQIAVSVRSTFSARSDFTGLTIELVKNLSGFPPNFISGNSVKHPWGGEIDVAPVATTGEFTVTFKEMPSDGCTSIATTTIDLVEQVNIGGTEVNLSATDDTSTPNDEGQAADIAALCNATPPNDIVWTFKG